MDRRTLLATVGSGLVVGCAGGGDTGEGSGGSAYRNWIENANNFDGEMDRTGQSRTRVLVGVEDGLAYGPAAIIVSPGTTVVWEWTGMGGGHNVVALEGAFESALTNEAGHTFEHTFPGSGLFRYYCTPHRDQGMRGGVRVRTEAGSNG